jgi:hypothetical protein
MDVNIKFVTRFLERSGAALLKRRRRRSSRFRNIERFERQESGETSFDVVVVVVFCKNGRAETRGKGLKG